MHLGARLKTITFILSCCNKINAVHSAPYKNYNESKNLAIWKILLVRFQ